MKRLTVKDAKNFWFMKEEVAFLRSQEEQMDEVHDDNWNWVSGGVEDYSDWGYINGKKVTIKIRPDLSWLIKNVYNLKVAISNLSKVASFLPKEYNGRVKKEMYLNKKIDYLLECGILNGWMVACRSMSARSMKAYRKTGAPCCKRYHSTFKALEQQIERLENRLNAWFIT